MATKKPTAEMTAAYREARAEAKKLADEELFKRLIAEGEKRQTTPASLAVEHAIANEIAVRARAERARRKG